MERREARGERTKGERAARKGKQENKTGEDNKRWRRKQRHGQKSLFYAFPAAMAESTLALALVNFKTGSCDHNKAPQGSFHLHLASA